MHDTLTPTDHSVTTRADADWMVFHGMPGWDEARLAWNLAVDQQPAAVALPRTPEEVVTAVLWAREQGLSIAVQGTGHGASARDPLDGTLLINTTRMRGVELDVVAQTARVGAGTLWEEVLEASTPHGLTALHGSAKDVGVVGYALGGGIGWYARKHGLTASSVRSVEVVTVDGEIVHADAETNADLFWALRGGGGSFAVVTAMEIELLPITTVFAGWLIWPIERAPDVLTTWAEWAATTPDEVTSVGRLLQIPPIPEMPDALRGRQFVVVEAVYLGDASSGRRLLAPLLALAPELDTFETVPAAAVPELHQDPPGPVPGVGHGWLLDRFDVDAAAAMVEAAAMDGTAPLLSVELRQLGGALGRPAATGGALSHLDGAFALYAVGALMGPVTAEAIESRIDDLEDALAPWSSGRSYLNFAERRTAPDALFPDGVAARLESVRSSYDPEQVLRANHPVG